MQIIRIVTVFGSILELDYSTMTLIRSKAGKVEKFESVQLDHGNRSMPRKGETVSFLYVAQDGSWKRFAGRDKVAYVVPADRATSPAPTLRRRARRTKVTVQMQQPFVVEPHPVTL